MSSVVPCSRPKCDRSNIKEVFGRYVPAYALRVLPHRDECLTAATCLVSVINPAVLRSQKDFDVCNILTGNDRVTPAKRGSSGKENDVDFRDHGAPPPFSGNIQARLPFADREA